MKYQERIQKDAQEASQQQFIVDQSKLQGQADLLAVRQQITALTSGLEGAKSTTREFSLTKCAELQYELVRLNEVYKVMEEVNTELFGE